MYCETYHCQLTERACRLRHEKALVDNRPGLRGVSWILANDPGCRACESGIRLARRHAMIRAAGDKLPPKGGTMESEKTALAAAGQQVCAVCGEPKELASGFYKAPAKRSGYDATCKKCRLSQDKRRRGKLPAESSKPEAGKLTAHSSKAEGFGVYIPAGLWQDIRDIAQLEFRTPENQVRYWLQRAISDFNWEVKA